MGENRTDWNYHLRKKFNFFWKRKTNFDFVPKKLEIEKKNKNMVSKSKNLGSKSAKFENFNIIDTSNIKCITILIN